MFAWWSSSNHLGRLLLQARAILHQVGHLPCTLPTGSNTWHPIWSPESTRSNLLVQNLSIASCGPKQTNKKCYCCELPQTPLVRNPEGYLFFCLFVCFALSEWTLSSQLLESFPLCLTASHLPWASLTMELSPRQVPGKTWKHGKIFLWLHRAAIHLDSRHSPFFDCNEK